MILLMIKILLLHVTNINVVECGSILELILADHNNRFKATLPALGIFVGSVAELYRSQFPIFREVL